MASTFAPVLSRFAMSFVRQSNSPKRTQIVENTPKHEFRVQWGGLGAFIAKNFEATSWHELLHLLHQFNPFCNKASCSNETIHNTPKHYETHQNMSLGSNGVDRVCLLEKNSDATSRHEILH